MNNLNFKRYYFVLRRKQLNITQEELANRLGLSVRSISDWENGRHLPRLTLRQTAIFCELLQCSIYELADLFEPLGGTEAN